MSLKKNYFWLIVFTAYLLGIVMGFVQNEPLIDEAKSNIPFTQKFIVDYPKFDLNYGGPASTPLAFVFISTLGKFFGTNIHFLRVLTSLISFLSFLVFYKILESKGGNYYLSALLLLFNPYFFRLSFTFYIGVWGILFAVLTVYYFLKPFTILNTFLMGSLLAASVLTQQFYLFLLPAIIVMFYMRNKSLLADKIDFAKHFLVFIIPQFSYVILFLYWKGLTSPEYQGVHLIYLKPQNIVFFFILSGFYFGWLIFKRFEWKKIYFAVLLSISFFIFFIPKYTGELKSGDMLTGLIMRFSDLLNSFNGSLQFLFLFILFLAGVIIFCDTINVDIWLLPLLFFTAAMAFNSVSGERYFIGVIPFLILYFSERIKDFGSKIIYVLPVYALLSIIYLFKWFFIKDF